MTAGRELPTPLGPARVLATEPAGRPCGTLVLGHGAGGGADSADLVAVAAAAAAAGWRVLRVEQPWRVAGKRVAPAPARLDVAWRAVLDALRASGELTGPLVLGGRSAGARVACRTAAGEQADGVLALAFPLVPPTRPAHPPTRPAQPPGRPGRTQTTQRSRATELAAVDVPLLVVQGERDAFGGPREIDAALRGHATAQVRAVPGDHGLKRAPEAVTAAVLPWLAAVVAASGRLSGGSDAPAR